MYLAGLFRTLGIADQLKSKLKQTPTGVFVGRIIASGEVEIGFQQVSELAHYPGIDYVGPLPADIQNVTVFSSGIHRQAVSVDAAKAWIAFLTSPAAAAVFRSKSMEPCAPLMSYACVGLRLDAEFCHLGAQARRVVLAAGCVHRVQLAKRQAQLLAQVGLRIRSAPPFRPSGLGPTWRSAPRRVSRRPLRTAS